MSQKYITKQEKLKKWVNDTLLSIGDGIKRNLNQYFSKALIEGFEREKVLKLLEAYHSLEKIDFDINKNYLISFMRIEEIKDNHKVTINDLQEIFENTSPIIKEEKKEYVNK